MSADPIQPNEDAPTQPLARLIQFFESLSLQQASQIGAFYTEDAYFKDPFNDVRGSAAITRIFEHMFEQVDEPRFRIHESVSQGRVAVLTWDFTFSLKPPLPVGPQCIHGCSHLRFDEGGRVSYHRDYWDAAEELYAKLPVLGALMRWLKRRNAIPPA